MYRITGPFHFDAGGGLGFVEFTTQHFCVQNPFVKSGKMTTAHGPSIFAPHSKHTRSTTYLLRPRRRGFVFDFFGRLNSPIFSM